MLTILWVLLWILLGAIALLIAMLCLPYSLGLSARSGPVPQVRYELRALSARLPPVLRLTQTLGAGDALSTEPPLPPKEGAPPAGRTRRRSRTRTDRILRAIRAGPALVLGLLKKFRLEQLRIEGRIGLDDPADTGLLFGYLAALIYLPRGGRVRIDLQPDFAGARFEAEAALRVRIVPISLAGPALAFAWAVFGKSA